MPGRNVFLSIRLTVNGFAARCEAMALPRRNVVFFDSGYAPGSGYAPTRSPPSQVEWNQRQVRDRTRAEPIMRKARYGEAEPSPHIKRRSRDP